MTAQVKLWLSVAALIVVSGGYVVWRSEERAKGALLASLASLTQENKALSGRVALDSVALLKRDTAVVFRNVLRTDTLLERLIDTAVVHHHDTVTVTREVLVEAKAALDSTKGVADACCTLARDWKARWMVSDSLYRGTVAAQPNFLERHVGVGVGYGVVEHGGVVYAGPSVAITWKVLP